MSERIDQQLRSKASRRVASSNPPLSEEAVESVAAMLRVFADPNRIRLIEALNYRGRSTVSALAACLSVTQQNVSWQLRVLYQAGIVSRHRDGLWVHYELTDFTGWWLVERLAAALDAS
jgi:ArsR family transcriptional regulator